MKFRFFLLILLLSVINAFASDLDFTLVNQTGRSFEGLYITASDNKDWDANILLDGEAPFLGGDGVPHSFSASFEKVTILNKDGPFYLFHVVLTSQDVGVDPDRSSYLVCLRLTERATESRTLTVIKNASDPPTENEI